MQANVSDYLERCRRMLYVCDDFVNPQSNGNWVCGSCAHGPDWAFPLGFKVAPSSQKEKIELLNTKIFGTPAYQSDTSVLNIDEYTNLHMSFTKCIDANGSLNIKSKTIDDTMVLPGIDKKSLPIFHAYFCYVASTVYAVLNGYGVTLVWNTPQFKINIEDFVGVIGKALNKKIVVFTIRTENLDTFNKFVSMLGGIELFRSEYFTNRKYQYTHNHLSMHVINFGA